MSVSVKPICSPASLNSGSTTTAFGCVFVAVGRDDTYGSLDTAPALPALLRTILPSINFL
jgi:hypothetical protein